MVHVLSSLMLDCAIDTVQEHVLTLSGRASARALQSMPCHAAAAATPSKAGHARHASQLLLPPPCGPAAAIGDGCPVVALDTPQATGVVSCSARLLSVRTQPKGLDKSCRGRRRSIETITLQ